MKLGVVTFPGSLDDGDAVRAARLAGAEAVKLWHADPDLHGVDAVILPGGFSYGDYLRCGAIARFAPVMETIKKAAADGLPVLGICNGFQILCEAHLLPGALTRNQHLHFRNRDQWLRLENVDSAWTGEFDADQEILIPVKNGEGCFVADPDTLDQLEANGQIVARYINGNPNGSMRDIAAIRNEAGNVLGIMPHPEHAVEALTGPSLDGLRFFTSVLKFLSASTHAATEVPPPAVLSAPAPAVVPSPPVVPMPVVLPAVPPAAPAPPATPAMPPDGSAPVDAPATPPTRTGSRAVPPAAPAPSAVPPPATPPDGRGSRAVPHAATTPPEATSPAVPPPAMPSAGTLFSAVSPAAAVPSAASAPADVRPFSAAPDAAAPPSVPSSGATASASTAPFAVPPAAAAPADVPDQTAAPSAPPGAVARPTAPGPAPDAPTSAQAPAATGKRAGKRTPSLLGLQDDDEEAGA